MKKAILMLTLAASLMLAACGEKEPEKIRLEGVYNGTLVEIGGLDEGESFSSFREMYAHDGTLSLVGSVMSETMMEQVVLTLDTAAGQWSRTTLPIESQPSSMAASEDGYLFVTSEFNRETFQQTYYLSGADADSVLWEKPLSELVELPERFRGGVSVAGYDGVWYIAVGDTLVSLDADGTVLASDTMAGEISGIFSAEDGLHVYGSDFHSVLSGDTLRDDAAWKSAMNGVNSVTLGSGYDFYRTSEMGLYGVSIADGTSELVMNWVNSGIPSAQDSIAVMSEDVIYIYRSDYNASLADERGLWRYEKCPEDQIPEREVIRITYSENGRGKIPLAAVLYNKLQAKYFVVCEEYASMGTSFDTMMLDGSIGDIVELEALTDLEKYGSKGYLADLNTLTGELIAADDIFGCVRAACETDGKLYGIPQEFALSTCAVKGGALDGYDTWNVDAFMELYEKLTGEGKYIIASNSGAGITEFLNEGMMRSFVDLDAGTCSFDSDEFVRVIEFLTSLPEKNTCELAIWDENHYITDEIFLYQADIGSYMDWAQMIAIYQGEAFDQVGYPSADGGVVKLTADKYYAVSDASRVKEGAMEFLAYFLSGDCVLDEMRGMRKIPALKSSMEAWNESEGKMYYYFFDDNIGRTSGSTQPFDEAKQGPGMQIFAGDPEIVNGLYDFLDSAQVAKPLPVDVQAIIDEELSAYLAGDKSAAETAKLIQNRVGTYLAEQK